LLDGFLVFLYKCVIVISQTGGHVDVNVRFQSKQFNQFWVLLVTRKSEFEALSEIREIFTRQKKWQLR
jgi:hypothetical protein